MSKACPPTQDCAALPTGAATTVYFGAVEVRTWKVSGQEQVLTTPHPAVKLLNGSALPASCRVGANPPLLSQTNPKPTR